jgi:tetratricopeptide (TPR) repeat protein/predicted Ser/Thr protein kinase
VAAVPDSERDFARTIVEMGLVRPEHVDACLADLERLAAEGAPLPRLAELLILRGYMSGGDAPRIDFRVFGKFRLEEKIGSGGMGEVWRARDTELDRVVALKFLKGTDADEIERFRREAQTAAKLTHPNIAAVHEVGEAGGVPYIAMQYVRGHTLLALPERTPEIAARLVRDAARALEYAHRNGVIHRDIKPANIMVEGERVYVMDFGLARRTDAKSSLSASGVMIGTPAYMSPEQARGDHAQVDARSDIYGLGATLYHLLGGQAPFDNPSILELIVRIVEEEPAALPGVDADLQAIVLKCLEKERERRYPTAAALADDLDRWLAGDVVTARAPSPLRRIRKRVARSRAAFAALVLVAGVAGAAGLFVPRMRRDAEARAFEADVLEPLRGRLTEDLKTEDGARRALAQVDAALRKNDTFASAWVMKGQLHERVLQWDAALAAYAEALRRNPNVSSAHYRRGRIFFFVRYKLDEALAEFERAGGDNEYALVGRAQVALLRGRFEEALEWCAKAEALNQQLGDLHFVRGYAFSHGGDERRAEASYTRALEHEPRNAMTWNNRAACRNELREWAGALADTEEALKLAPAFDMAWANRGRSLLELGRYAEAITHLSRAIELNPRLRRVHENRGEAHWRAGELVEAMADFDRALEADPASANAHVGRGNVHREGGRDDEALAEFSRAIELDPKLAQARVNRGAILHKRGRVDEALADYEAAIAADPRCAEAYLNRGTIAHGQGRWDAAIADYAKGAELTPEDARVWYNLGLARRASGDRAGAIREFTRSIERDARWVPAWRERGDARAEAGEMEAALDDYSRAIAADPRYVEAYVARGTLHASRDAPDAAIADFTAALALEPRNLTALTNRGTMHRRKGNREAAIADWEHALAAAPASWPHRDAVRRWMRELRGE